MSRTTVRFSPPGPPRDRRGWAAGLLAGILVLAAPASGRAAPLPLDPSDQARVDKAINRGVYYLKKTQLADGTWGSHRGKARVGYAALPGLTLLECGVPATSPLVRRAAGTVRRGAPALDTTYELSLAILFLDRVGEPKDEKIIQTLAVRLIAGQTATGGWSYTCPIVNSRNHKDVLAVLRKLNPPPAPGKGLDGLPVDKKPGGRPPAGGITEPKRKRPAGGPETKPSSGGATADLTRKPGKPAGGKARPAKNPVPRHLRELPVFQDADGDMPAEPMGRGRRFLGLGTDNSNTQFAILALWVAQRHGVPMERTAALIVKRFETSQNPDGTWKYRYVPGGSLGWGTPAMTGVGLLGLAVGHGLARDGEAAKKAVKDPRLLNGLVALSRDVGEPTGMWKRLPQESLYVLWSIERVGVLFDLPTLAGKDWYRWGAEQLVANQASSGNWQNGGYPGASPPLDTSFALLFLKRANLVADLTARLPYKPKELTRFITTQSSLTPQSSKSARSPGEEGSVGSPFDKKDTDKKPDKKEKKRRR